MTATLTHRLDRTVAIEASRDVVFRFFTDPARWATWWGAGSTIDARPGGEMVIRYPGGTMALGHVLEVEPPQRIVFTYGYATGQPIPPGASRVTIELEPNDRGTRLHFTHDFDSPAVRDQHVQGWRYQLSVFANVVADEVHARAAERVDAWFAAWADPNDDVRRAGFTGIVAADVRFKDRYSLLQGIADLVEHTGAAQRFMPGIRMTRRGDVRHCQGTALVDWEAVGPDGQPRMTGTNVFVFNSEGQITSVTGVANPPRKEQTS
jgi:uncharacterized protein YndB with AHSA1/START domain